MPAARRTLLSSHSRYAE